jgi:hypothetical protein
VKVQGENSALYDPFGNRVRNRRNQKIILFILLILSKNHPTKL